MLRNVKDVNGYAVVATDGELGSVQDFYFDDEAWAMRYVIVDTGKWLPGPQVLISPISIGQPDWVARQLAVALTRDQVRNSPPIDTRQPVSRQQEQQHLRYYGYPYYWIGPSLWGPVALPTPALPSESAAVPPSSEADSAASHLRSCGEVAGYHLQATDGTLGHVEDFLFDDLDWAIRWLVVDTSDWWFGHKVLIAPEWVEGIDWAERRVRVDVTREAVEHAPRYDAVGHVNRQWEADYYAHHQRPPYWLSAGRARALKARHLRAPVITK
jgi:uncharacterized protein YrrD